MIPKIQTLSSWVLVGLLLCLCVRPYAWGQEYKIGAGDVLTITVWGHPDLSRDYTVDPDGFAPFPLINRVKAGGLTTREVAASLVDLLGKDYLVNPQVIVSVKEYLSQKVTILGETARPGVFYLTGPTSLVDVLSKPGGCPSPPENKSSSCGISLSLGQRAKTATRRSGGSASTRFRRA